MLRVDTVVRELIRLLVVELLDDRVRLEALLAEDSLTG